MQKNIFTEIRAQYEYLSRVEKNIADLILSEPKYFITQSMSEIAKRAKVSQGSVNNFAKKFSSGGFSALKLKVAGCLSEHREEPFALIDGKDSIKTAMELKIAETLAAFRNTLELNDESTLQAAVDKILVAKKIEIYGVYHSGIVARDFCYQLIRLGIPATFVSDALMCAASASMLDSNGLVIAISSSGRTKELIEVAEIARENGAQVICITSYQFSPLTKLADAVLLSAHSGMSVSDRWEESRMTQMLLLDTLCSYIGSRIEAGDQAHFERLQKIFGMHSVED